MGGGREGGGLEWEGGAGEVRFCSLLLESTIIGW